jgi:hypothetical protein
MSYLLDSDVFIQAKNLHYAWFENYPRAPKVTVTRKGDSLCQKGCYPMALLFLFVSLWSQYVFR